MPVPVKVLFPIVAASFCLVLGAIFLVLYHYAKEESRLPENRIFSGIAFSLAGMIWCTFAYQEATEAHTQLFWYRGELMFAFAAATGLIHFASLVGRWRIQWITPVRVYLGLGCAVFLILFTDLVLRLPSRNDHRDFDIAATGPLFWPLIVMLLAAAIAASLALPRTWKGQRGELFAPLKTYPGLVWLALLVVILGGVVEAARLLGGFSDLPVNMPSALAVLFCVLIGSAQLQETFRIADERSNLQRHVGGAVFRYLIANPDKWSPGGVKAQVTAMFADIRGFTKMSRKQEPESVVGLLNEYFQPMTTVIVDEFQGTLDKFIGDGVLAYWGAPQEQKDHAQRAVRCALAMLRELEKLNARRQQRSDSELRIGIGIATGEVVFGNIGAKDRLDFTIIGDTINLASRLCGEAKPGQILVPEGMIAAVENIVEARALGPLPLKGFGAVLAFNVIGLKEIGSKGRTA